MSISDGYFEQIKLIDWLIDHVTLWAGVANDCIEVDAGGGAIKLTVSEGSTYQRAAAVLQPWPWDNSMTLKLEGDIDILKMYLHTENEG